MCLDTPICAYSAGVFVGFVNILGNRQDVVCIEHTCQARGDEACLFELLPASQAEGTNRCSLYDLIPAWAANSTCWKCSLSTCRWASPFSIANTASNAITPPGMISQRVMRPLQRLHSLLASVILTTFPAPNPSSSRMFERVLAGETVQQNNVRLESEGIVTYWDVVLAPLIEDDEIVGILIVSIDATERASLRQNLEQRVSARTQELQMLLDVAATANSSLNLDEMLTKTLDLLVDLVGASRAGVGLIDEKTGKLKSSHSAARTRC